MAVTLNKVLLRVSISIALGSLYITPILSLQGREAFTEFPVPTPAAGPGLVAATTDGTIWFTETWANKVGRVSPGGSFREYELSGGGYPLGIAIGSDHTVWF